MTSTKILWPVQTQVLAGHKSLTQKIEKWEKEFLLKHGFPPTYENVEQEGKVKAAYKKKIEQGPIKTLKNNCACSSTLKYF